MIKVKLEKLKEEVEVFESYDQVDKVKKAYERLLYFDKLTDIRNQSQNLLTEKKKVIDQREELIRQYEQLQMGPQT